ncbi:choice-of-anchor M domain-containing protein [Canibacter sp. lx-45]|uniref:choice-of-anchor M domain-containing protein n=1 Tax=Canibacter zhuwentaonis TaxID=2837491 RepID=UPI001BDD539A|nr:choice-of-anchor M domain-containing protein [Canibacter zhuwentaonis]MBT1034862.1 choice-of-anchor M domain-containing protein [Canibacter zhuwentaonis]
MQNITQKSKLRALRQLGGSFIAATILLSCAFIGGANAVDNPPAEEQKIVATRAHVDSPKVFYEDGRLVLKSEFSHNRLPLEKTINYLGPGYNYGKQRFIFRVPEHAPELDFLGKAGTSWYMGPDISGLRHPVIWSGYAADAGVPIENFRDKSFTLDLIDVKGPGRVELLGWYEAEDEGGAGFVKRLLSSSDANYRSAKLSAGTHTHNYNLFEKPGRYELIYRATARTTAGEFISSEIKTLEWQVGGNEPGQQIKPEPVHKDETEQPEGKKNAQSIFSLPKEENAQLGFSIAPANAKTPEDVIASARDLRVVTDKTLAGTAQFYIDGFKLAEVELHDGQAGYTEMIGASAGKYQVAVKNQQGEVVYTSAVLNYGPETEPGKTVNTAETGEIIAAAPAAAPQFLPENISYDSDIKYTVASEPVNYTNTRRVTVAVDRDGVYGLFWIVRRTSDGQVQSEYMFSSGQGSRSVSFYTEDNDGLDGSFEAIFLPHPAVTNLKSSVLKVAEEYQPNTKYSATGEIKRENSAQPTPPTVTPSVPAPAEPGSDVQHGGDTPLEKRLLIRKGHLDIAVYLHHGKASMVLKDSSREHSKQEVNRSVRDIAIAVADTAIQRRLPKKNKEEWQRVFDYEGINWVLPEAQKLDLPWPGYSSETVSEADINGTMKLEMTDFSGPGELNLYSVRRVAGIPEVLLGSGEGKPRSFDVYPGDHLHTGWVFTKPGVYSVELRYTGEHKSGERFATPAEKLFFLVGDKAIADNAPADSIDKTPQRLSGEDRFATAVQISKQYSAGVKALFITDGGGYADALGAGAAAAHLESPVLLSSKTEGINSATLAEIRRLNPQTVYIVGGEHAVTRASENALRELAREKGFSLERIAGDDRYETNRLLALKVFNGKFASAVIATGRDFPDALAATSLAGAKKAPVLLVDGKQAGLSSATKELLGAAKTKYAVILGGTAAVSGGIESDLRRLGAQVVRKAGEDRYETAFLVNQELLWNKPQKVYFASGETYADALTGGAKAALDGAPLLLTAGSCLSKQTADAIAKYAPSAKRIILGGNMRVGDGVFELASCAVS